MSDRDRLPIDPTSGEPIGPLAQPGYYPGYSTLSQQGFWDAATRRVVGIRTEEIPPVRFFTAEEAALMGAVLDRLIPQDDRDQYHRIPVLNYLDNRLFTGQIDGYRFEDMPPDGEAYRVGLKGIDAVAIHLHGAPFVDLGPDRQDEVLWTLHDDNPPAGDEFWRTVPCDRFWLMMMQDAVDAYYQHPWAWDEIGFGGPSYPRGYFRLENGAPEPWEVEERRYEWSSPPTSSSDQFRALGGRIHHAGQEGTH